MDGSWWFGWDGLSLSLWFLTFISPGLTCTLCYFTCCTLHACPLLSYPPTSVYCLPPAYLGREGTEKKKLHALLLSHALLYLRHPYCGQTRLCLDDVSKI